VQASHVDWLGLGGPKARVKDAAEL